MSIKIHHGPNGSYKTSGAIQDDAVRALKDGRTVVTNIRGFTLERATKVFPDLPETANIINLDLESTDDLNRMRLWWHWVPQGAFVIFDETQILFPKSWREADLAKFDYPGGLEKAQEDKRPINWLDAWTRHRHFGWDVVLTTPNITYIRDDIRATCEMAYKHSNLAAIGWKGRYKEAMHPPHQNIPTGEFVNEIKKIKPTTFQLYESTATGTHRDTTAGKSILRNPKLLFFVTLTVGLILFMFASGKANPLASLSPREKPLETVEVGNEKGSTTSAVVSAVPDADRSASSVRVKTDSLSMVNHPFKGRTIYIMGLLQNERKRLFWLSLETEETILQLNSDDLVKSGYQITYISDCVAKLTYQNYSDFITCKGAFVASTTVPSVVNPVDAMRSK